MTLNVADRAAATPKRSVSPQLPPRHSGPSAAGSRLEMPPRRPRSAQAAGLRPRARRAVPGAGAGASSRPAAGGDGGARRPRWSTDSADSLLSGSSGSSEGSVASPDPTADPCRVARRFRPQPPPPPPPAYRAVLLGEPGVGKSALARIFGGVEDDYDADFVTEDCYQRSVLVDGEETVLSLIELCGQAGDDCLDDESARAGDAYIIVYSIAERASFERAAEMRIQVRKARQADDVPIILVGNKSDLVRSREVSVDEGRACAAVFDCKFIETSAALQHNVRELYHGVVRQLRLRRQRDLDLDASGSGGRLLPSYGLASSSSCSSSASSSNSSSCSAGSAAAPSSPACPRHHPACHHHRYARRKESLTKRAWRILSRFMVARGAGRLAFRVKSKSCHDLSVL